MIDFTTCEIRKTLSIISNESLVNKKIISKAMFLIKNISIHRIIYKFAIRLAQ